MNKYKIIVTDQEISRKVQEHALKLGYRWLGASTSITKTGPFIYLGEYGDEIICHGAEDYTYLNIDLPAISARDFLTIPIPEPVVDITVCVNGKEVPLSTISEKTLLAIRRKA